MRDTVIHRLAGGFILWVAVRGAVAVAQPAVVSGNVTATGLPVRSASVTFQDAAVPPNVWTGVTDSTGHYQIDLLLTSARQSPALPSHFSLGQNYPNPFSSRTIVPYSLSRQSAIELTVYDVLGRVVRRIAAGSQPAGSHAVLWDGTNSQGQRVAEGIYFYTLSGDGVVQARKMVLGGAAPPGISLAVPASPGPAGTGSAGTGSAGTGSAGTGSAGTGAAIALQGGAFSVRVDDTTGTSPWIATTLFTNYMIQGDTTLNFTVGALPVATVVADSVKQVIRGFGAANILPWRPDMTAAEVLTAFGAGPGQLGFTILRLRIPYTDDASDFSANLPSAQLAESLGAIVFATPWTPPPALKTNNNIVGGMLADTAYASYAAHLKGFADYMTANGAPLYAVSLQNEPDAVVTYESCSWNATQFLNFTKNNAAAIGTRIIMPESEGFNHQFSDSTLQDPTAASHVAIVGGHLYGPAPAAYPLAAGEGKDLWMTEHLSLDTTWAGDLATGKEINDCMTVGMNAYVTWYIVRYYGPIAEDGTVTRRGYVMSQYGRFVRPGFRRIQCTPAPQRSLWLTAYADSVSGRVVIVAINTAAAPVQQAFAIPGRTLSAFAVYATSASKNCAQGSDVHVSGGGCVVTLDASSVTTLVSK